MGSIKDINIKNRTYHFYDDMINIKHFDLSLLKLHKNSLKYIVILCLGYITKKDKYAVNS